MLVCLVKSWKMGWAISSSCAEYTTTVRGGVPGEQPAMSAPQNARAVRRSMINLPNDSRFMDLKLKSQLICVKAKMKMTEPIEVATLGRIGAGI